MTSAERHGLVGAVFAGDRQVSAEQSDPPVEDTLPEPEPEHSVWAVVTTDDRGRKGYRLPHGGEAVARRIAAEVGGQAILYTGRDAVDLLDLQDAAFEAERDPYDPWE